MIRETGYYALLDTVKFDARSEAQESLALNRAEAGAALLGNLLIGGIGPVLSQNQVFDNAYLLDLVADFGSPASRALLGLARDGVLRTRIFERGLRPASGNPFTIVNAFASQLYNSSFHLSAWPELRDSEARESLARVVLGESNDGLPELPRRRVEAVLALDRAFRASQDDERAIPLRGLSLLGLVRRDLDHQTGPRALQEMWSSVRAFLGGPEARGTYDLKYRSQWRTALDDFAESRGVWRDHPMIRRISDYVDLHYHRVIGASVGAGTTIDNTDKTALASSLLSSLARPGLREQAAFLMRGDSNRALTWDFAAEHLADLRPLSPAMRLELLLEEKLVEIAHDNLLVRVATSLPEHVLRAPAVLGAGIAGQAMGGSVVGAVLAATAEVTGAASVEAFLGSSGRASRLAGQWSDWVMERAVGRIRKSNMITTSTPDPDE